MNSILQSFVFMIIFFLYLQLLHVEKKQEGFTYYILFISQLLFLWSPGP